MSSDLEDELRALLADRADRIPIELTDPEPTRPEQTGRDRVARRVRRFAPLAAAFGVVIAATVGLFAVRLTTELPAQPAVSNTVSTVSGVSGGTGTPTTTSGPVRRGPVIQPHCPATVGPPVSTGTASSQACTG